MIGSRVGFAWAAAIGAAPSTITPNAPTGVTVRDVAAAHAAAADRGRPAQPAPAAACRRPVAAAGSARRPGPG